MSFLCSCKQHVRQWARRVGCGWTDAEEENFTHLVGLVLKQTLFGLASAMAVDFASNQTFAQTTQIAFSAPRLDNHFSSIIIRIEISSDMIKFFHSFLFLLLRCCLWNRCFLNKFSYLFSPPEPRPGFVLHRRRRQKAMPKRTDRKNIRRDEKLISFYFALRKEKKTLLSFNEKYWERRFKRKLIFHLYGDGIFASPPVNRDSPCSRDAFARLLLKSTKSIGSAFDITF